jgi:predicted DCC family thiol-disulfide oxidoreductase YuxK
MTAPPTIKRIKSMHSLAATPSLSVYYDGGCPLCRAEIAAYQRLEGAEKLRWLDLQSCTTQELGEGLDRQVALKRMHVRRADGRLVDGAAAFVEIWSVLPGWARLARLARLPGVVSLMELGYRVFLVIRPLWRRPPASCPR